MGAEFCARRLPPAAEVREAARRCRDRGLSFSLVTPAVGERDPGPVARWLSALAPALGGVEWVANDWGLLRWAQEEGVPLRPVAGRLLGHQVRDPGALDRLWVASSEESRGLRGSAWDDPETAGLLAGLGVGRVELDLLVQGARVPTLPPGVAVSLCGPWIPVTLLAPPCPPLDGGSECPESHPGEAAEPAPGGASARPLIARSHALFLRIDDLPPGRALAASGADRLVWSPEIPG